MQPASSPYDIAEKLKHANEVLEQQDISDDTRQIKVKFKDNLIDFEPEPPEPISNLELESICSSDSLEDYSVIENDTTVLENHFKTSLVISVPDDDTDEEGEIQEEIAEETPAVAVPTIGEAFEELTPIDVKAAEDSEDEDTENLYSDHLETGSFPRKCPKRPRKSRKSIKQDVNCKDHCIERLYSSAYVSKMKWNEIQLPCQVPILKLHRRTCCEKNEQRCHEKLPSYNGLRSEYGLDAKQLEKRKRSREILFLRREEKQRLTEENKIMRRQQNEQIFRQWLKSVSDRKISRKMRRSSSPSYAKLRCRPKTAICAQFSPNNTVALVKNRIPPTRIYIELSPTLLRKGIGIGSIFLSSSDRSSSRRLHAFTIK